MLQRICLHAALLMQMLAAGGVQLGWAIMAHSQQVQPGAAHASALLESAQSILDSEEDNPGRAPFKTH